MPFNLNRPAPAEDPPNKPPTLFTVGRVMPFMEEIPRRGMWWWDGWRKPPVRSAIKSIDYDFVLTAETAIAAAVLCENGISVWTFQTDRAGMEREAVWPSQDKWARVGTFAAPFEEPFHFAAAGGAYFFVTDESREVYIAVEEKEEWKSRALWKDASRPIVAMLTLSDSPTTFVFGKDFYMKLGRDNAPKPCRDVVRGPTEPADSTSTQTLYECAKILDENGELKR